MSPVLDIYGILLAKVENKSVRLPIKFYPESGSHHLSEVETLALLDSGAGGIFIDRDYQQQLDLPTHPLKNPITVHNVDGTRNKKGFITDYVKLRLKINDRTGPVIAHVTGLGRQRLILGYPWLQDWNPDVNWKMGSLRWRDTEERSVNNPAGEPSKPKYRDREHEGQEDARENSGGRPNGTYREPAIMALTCQLKEPAEGEEGISPNEKGMDDLKSLAEQGYLSEAVNELRSEVLTPPDEETRERSHNWEDDVYITEDDWSDIIIRSNDGHQIN